MSAGDLRQFLRGHSVPDDVIDELEKSPHGIKTVRQFSNYSESKAEVRTLFFEKIQGVTTEGSVLANLRQAWREAEGVTAQSGVLNAYPPPVAHNVTSLRSQQRAMDTTTRLRNRTHLLDEEYYNALDPHLFGYGSDEPQSGENVNANSPTNTTTTADWDHVS